ncbi:RHS repeat domain-containing protein [Cellulomonas cellasea]|uniref:RHS repeat-associated protein n=1 Tax=Cellulomonas cellasea TaxID=43670 RepID=A0A7W4YCQ1_9CELL|nr:RHS repeat-associated core domain-containing protein [Cellulomonas cellasea]MBB2923756.1 RHS repeat-associated protein [Cellulomonas cellasea]
MPEGMSQGELMGFRRLRSMVGGTVSGVLLVTVGLVTVPASAADLSRDRWTAEERRAHGAEVAPERDETPPIESSTTPVRDLVATPGPVPRPMRSPREPRRVRWPSAGTSTLNVSPGAEAGRDAISLERERPSAGTDRKVKVQVFDHAKATDAGVDGVLLKISPNASTSDEAPVDVSVDYTDFADAYGGDWAHRLRLVSMPACALTTPEVAACRKQTPVESVNDVETSSVSASVSVASASVMAVSAGAGSSAGNWGATPLAPSSTWNVSEQTGAFNWSYPLRVAPGVGGPEPKLALGYSASSIDGKVASTNNQTSWIGDGWDLSTGFIERKYTPCSMDKTGGNNASLTTGDQCWAGDNATMAFTGHGGDLVKDAVSGTWRLKDDDSTRIERLTGGFNDDNDGEYWKVTTPDGMQYYFGRGKRSSTDTLALNSAWSMPVFGNQAGEPCYNASYASAWCTQTWRWNLDYVVDPSGNSMTFVYAAETNKYGRNQNQAVSTYTRGGYLTRIDYGQRAGAEATTAPMKVDFGVAERCLPSGSVTCDPAQLTAANAASWPDVPFDRICTGTSCPNVTSPAFFTTKRLTTVTTSVHSSGSYTPVDTWTLKHTYPDPGDGTSPALFLSAITHAGKVGGTVTLPDVTFVGEQMANRVDKLGDLGPPMNRFRLSSITSESGATTSIEYTAEDCTSASLPATADSNTRRCFPVRWVPAGQVGPVVEYFHKYLVDSIVESPNDVLSPPIETYYSYVGTPAWHYDDNTLVPAAERTWSEFRGYDTVDVITGDPSASVRSQERMRFFRGMHGDKLANGSTRAVSIDGIADTDRLNGFLREQITYNGVGGAEVDGQVFTPWVSPATATGADGTTSSYRGTATSEARVTAPALAGGKRTTRTVTTFENTYGTPTEIDDLGDIAVDTDDRCTRNEYVHNTTAWILGTLKRAETVGVKCAATPARPADVLADEKTSYDGLAYGAAPTRGLPTTKESLKSYSGGAPVYLTDATTVYDALGRPVSVTDTLGRATSTSFTPAISGPLTSMTTTGPDPDGSGPGAAFVSTTVINPAWGAVWKSTDANGKVTTATFDALGRTTAVWKPGRAQASATPHATYAYTVSRTAPNTVTTKTLDANENYQTTVELFDGLLRQRQTQSPSHSTSNPGRMVTDKVYDSRGAVTVANSAWLTTGEPGTTVVYPVRAVPSRVRYEYDGAGRATAEIMDVSEQERSRVTTTYGGDRVNIDPPTGATPTTSITDGRGQQVELRQYLGAAPTGAYQAASYAYDRGGRMTKAIDAANNVWTYGYDLRGRQVSASDPDKGTSTTVYDDGGQVVSTTDAKSATLFYVRDQLGRQVELRDSSATGTVRASWTYDTLAKGQLTSSTRKVGGASYTTALTGYDDAYRPLGKTISLPGAEVGQSGTFTYTTGYTYMPDGQVADVTQPAVGGLDAETDSTFYDSLGKPEFMTGGFGSGVYVADTLYDEHGRVERYDLGNTYAYFVNYLYETGTGRLDETWVERENGVGRDKDVKYTYDLAGNPTSIVDTATGTPTDAQCYRYDGLRRLSSAWTPANANCGTTPTAAGLGGPAPYWKDYTFDAIGNRKTEITHTSSGDTTQTYAYPASGASSTRPHAVTSVTQSGVGGAATSSYLYDDAGNTTTRNRAGKTGQTLTWDAEQRLTSVTEGSSTATYLYSADGERLIRKQNGITTIYLQDGTELTRSATGKLSAARYYAFNGSTVAVRTGNNADDVSTLVPDTQGTAQLSITNVGGAVTKRRTDPYGNPRGKSPAWIGDHGFLDKPLDTTGLNQVGARYYDAAIARFTSVDPVMSLDDPQQWAGYSYSNNNPVTYSDPTGLLVGKATSGYKKSSIPKRSYSRQSDFSVSLGIGVVNSLIDIVNTPAHIWNFQMRKYRLGSSLAAPLVPSIKNPRTDAANKVIEGVGYWSLIFIPISKVGLVGKAAPYAAKAEAAASAGAAASRAAPAAAARTSEKVVSSAPPRYGSASGPWSEGVAARPGGAEAQLTGGSCVSACGAMLSGRSQTELLAKLGDWSNPQALARELGDGWIGGFFGSGEDAVAAASRGPMGATLQAGMGPGHMVMTSPLGNGRFLVRDPWAGGSSYEVSSGWISQYVNGGVFR